MAFCPYLHCQQHAVHHIGSRLINLEKLARYYPLERARWKHEIVGPCCEWCDAFKDYAPALLLDIEFPQFFDPNIDAVAQIYFDIHDYYKRGAVGRFDNYDVSCAIEELSRLLWDLFKLDPFFYWNCSKIAEQLRGMATELQIGPPRDLFHTMPRTNYPGC